MDDRTVLFASIFAIIVVIPIIVVVAYLVNDQMKAKRNRAYKTLAEHEILNNAGDRAAWMSGVVPQEGDEKVDRFTSRVAPIAQLAMLALLLAVIFIWNESLVKDNAKLNERLDQVELQIHALSFSVQTDGVSAPHEPDPAPGAGAAPMVNPMQQACANLIGRVADAYEKGETSKIALSLEALVDKLGCKNNPVP